jgi:hypothetical protein
MHLWCSDVSASLVRAAGACRSASCSAVFAASSARLFFHRSLGPVTRARCLASCEGRRASRLSFFTRCRARCAPARIGFRRHCRCSTGRRCLLVLLQAARSPGCRLMRSASSSSIASASLTDACADFLLDLFGVRLDATDRLWFFSDWATVAPRTFEERFHDLCISRGVLQSSHAGPASPRPSASQGASPVPAPLPSFQPGGCFDV